MELQQLRYLVAVAECGGFRAAARRLQMSQPPLSEAVSRLERQLGIQLFIRSSRGVELTTHGQTFVERARDLLDRLDAAVLEVRDGRLREPIIVGLSEGRLAAAELTHPLLNGFRGAHPDARLVCRELNIVEQIEAVVSGRVDVAIVRSPLLHPDVETVPLFAEPRVLLVQHGHPLAKRESVRGRQLLDLPMLDLRSVRQEWNAFWRLDDIRGEPGRRRPSLAVTLDEVYLDIALSGAALTVAASVPRLAPNPILASVSIEEVPASIISLISRRRSRRRNVEAFIRHAQAVAHEASTLVPGAEPVSPRSW